ncbi:MAG: hypothetical protein ACI3ZN_04065, partial [Candidatus Cryptobacteroides sp.]
SNFMMASANAVKRTINDYYSNNKVEKYWADDECLVHIKTGTPYYCPKEKNIQSLNGNLEKELPILFDLAILAFIKNELLTFLVDHQNMSVSEIDNVQSIIARILYCKLFNQTELDKRMDYFIRKFHLVNLFENIKCTILPIKDIKEINFLRRTTYLTLMVAGLTLLATIIGIIVSLNS